MIAAFDSCGFVSSFAAGLLEIPIQPPEK